MYIVSACLLGDNCKYNGENNYTEWVDKLKETNTICKVCPESMGKLLTPRPPAEIVDGRVINKEGEDVTSSFEYGAKIAYTRAVVAAKSIGEEIEGAILKANSPSCGCGKIYDGTFTGKLVEGDGVFTKLLKEHNIKVYTEKEKV